MTSQATSGTREADRPSELNKPSPLLNVEETARYLSLAVSTLNKMRMSGLGPRYIALTSRRVAYDLQDLRAWVAERKRNHTSQQQS